MSALPPKADIVLQCGNVRFVPQADISNDSEDYSYTFLVRRMVCESRSGLHLAFLEACLGGQGTEPYEQNTQQSPRLGRKSVLHPVHS
jgi:hypothetical protein